MHVKHNQDRAKQKCAYFLLQHWQRCIQHAQVCCAFSVSKSCENKRALHKSKPNNISESKNYAHIHIFGKNQSSHVKIKALHKSKPNNISESKNYAHINIFGKNQSESGCETKRKWKNFQPMLRIYLGHWQKSKAIRRCVIEEGSVSAHLQDVELKRVQHKGSMFGTTCHTFLAAEGRWNSKACPGLQSNLWKNYICTHTHYTHTHTHFSIHISVHIYIYIILCENI